MASWLSSKDIPCHVLLLLISLDHLPVVNSSACPGTAHQSLFSICQSPCILVDLHPHPGYVGPWHGWSVWFSLHSECHRAAASLSDSQKCFPSVPTDCPGCRGISPASASQPSAAGLVPLSLLLSSFLHPTDLCVDPHISFQLSWTSDDISWCFMRTAASVDVFLMHPWKEICSMSTYSSTIFSRNLCF